MDLQKKYEKETGKQARIKVGDGVHNTVLIEIYSDDYVHWLEKRDNKNYCMACSSQAEHMYCDKHMEDVRAVWTLNGGLKG